MSEWREKNNRNPLMKHFYPAVNNIIHISGQLGARDIYRPNGTATDHTYRVPKKRGSNFMLRLLLH